MTPDQVTPEMLDLAMWQATLLMTALMALLMFAWDIVQLIRLSKVSVNLIVLAIGIAILISVALAASLGAQTLIDRDSESWGYPQGGVRITGGNTFRLATKVGHRQRFNPAVVAQKRALTNVKLYIEFPDTVRVERSDAWVRQSGRTVSAYLGAINPGEALSAFDALHFTADASGTLRLAYLVSAHEIQPKSGTILIEVRP